HRTEIGSGPDRPSRFLRSLIPGTVSLGLHPRLPRPGYVSVPCVPAGVVVQPFTNCGKGVPILSGHGTRPKVQEGLRASLTTQPIAEADQVLGRDTGHHPVDTAADGHVDQTVE